MIVIVDSGGSNINSVQFALERLGKKSILSGDPDVISAGERVILPGVGAAPVGMKKLHDRGLVECLKSLTQPVLGICLGMQLLHKFSDEGATDCLDILPNIVKQMEPKDQFPVPHMGWNQIEIQRDSPLLTGLNGKWFYFVHSFAVPVDEHCLASTDYDGSFCSVTQKDNYFGAQFHPEKSASAGQILLSNFCNL